MARGTLPGGFALTEPLHGSDVAGGMATTALVAHVVVAKFAWHLPLYRQAQMFAAALAGRHAADHLRAIGDRLFGVEGALGSGDPLADDFGVFVNENGHA